MQVTSLSPTTVEIEPPAGTSAPADPSAEGGFAAMLAQLLGAASDDAKAAADLDPVEAAPADDDAKPDTTADPTQAAIALAAAAVLPQQQATTTTPATPPAPDTVAPPTATAPQAPAPATTTVEVDAPQTEVVVEAPAEAPVPAVATPQPTPARTPAKAERSTPSPTLESTAEYTVLPSPAAAAAPKAAVAAAQPTQEIAPPQITAPAAASAVAVESSAVLAQPAQSKETATPAALHEDDAEEDGILLSAAKTSAAKADKPPTAEPAQEPAPVLEKYTPVLARNALRDNLRDSSARELLASAREPEHADKPAENTTPSPLPPGEAAQRVTLRTANAAQTSRTDTAHTLTSSLPTLGDDLVKHVTLHSGPGERTLTLKLLPESLGEVQVEVKSSLDNVTVRLVSQDPSVRQALEHHASGLREALASDGRETRVEIGSQLMGNMGQTNDGAWTSRQTQQDAQDRPRWFPQPSVGSDPIPQAAKRIESRPAEHAGVLNLFA